MGLFDKKSRLDAEFEALEDEIQEESSLEVVNSTPAPSAKPPPRPQKKPQSPPSLSPPRARYGIEKALDLVRALPADVNEAMLAIVRKTLESADVQVDAVVEEAALHQQGIQRSIQAVETEIAGFDAEIAARRAQITSLRAELEQITKVWLVFAPRSPTAAKQPARRPPPSPPSPLENAFGPEPRSVAPVDAKPAGPVKTKR